MHVVSGWGRMFPYVSVLSFFTTYLQSTWLWFTFFLTTALYLLYDYLPNLAIDFLSNWDEALLLRDVTVIHQLFPWVIGFYVLTTICGALAGLCDRYLTTSMANQFSKKSLSLALSPRYLHLWLGDAKYSKAKTPLAGTIVRDPERYFNNMPKLIASFVAALVFTVIAVFRLLDFGLHGSLAYACFFGAGAMMSVFYITRSWNEQYLNKLNASQRATDTLHELRFSQNVFSQPNTLPLYRRRITGSLDKIQSSQRAIARLRFFSDLFSGVLDSCMQPLFMVVVFYSIYYTQAGTVTYSTLRMLARLMVSIYSALVAIIKNRESLAEMQTSLVNMRGLESEFKPLPTHKLGLRTDHPGLYAKGEYAMDKQSICACFSVYKDSDNDPSFSYDHNKKMRLSLGSRYALIGANGSGKSTFLRVLSGYIPMENPSQKIPHVVYYANDGHSLAHIMGTCPVIWGLVLYYWPLKHDVDDLSSLKPTYMDQKRLPCVGGATCLMRDVLKSVNDNLSKFGLEKGVGKEIAAGSYSDFQSACSQGQKKALLASVILAVAKWSKPDLVLLDEIASEVDMAWLEILDRLIDSHVRESHFTVVEVRHPNVKKRLEQLDGLLCMHENRMYRHKNFQEFNTFAQDRGMVWQSHDPVSALQFSPSR